MTQRNKFIRFLFQSLQAHKYVLLKHIAKDISQLDESSDLDFLIPSNEVQQLLSKLTKHPDIDKYYLDKRSSMTQIFLYFQDGSFLQLDFLFQFIRKDTIYLSAAEIQRSKTKNEEGIYTCSLEHLLEHLVLFNFLNYAGIPKKYIHFFANLSEITQQDILDYFNQKYATTIRHFFEFGVYDNHFRNQLLVQINQLSENSFVNNKKHKLNYMLDTIGSFKANRGLTMSFSGVDGAGKSTIINEVKDILTNKYRRKVVVLRHRPSLLPILSAYKHGKKAAEQKAATTLPRQGSNKNKLSSVLRFMYYYTDYLFGQFYVFVKYNLRGYVILYDRYYFDFIVDGRRSNIQLDSKLPKFLYRFVYKPSLNLFLYASPEEILKRKQELPSEEIVTLTKKYKSLFSTLASPDKEKEVYLTIENINKEQTLQKIMTHYKQLV